MHLIPPTCLLLFLSVVAYSQSQPYDVKKVRWGMNREQVLKSEAGKPVVNNEQMLSYEGVKVAEHEVLLRYYFKQGKLSQVSYDVPSTEYDGFMYATFRDIQARLTEKYGEPKGGNNWIDKTHKDDASASYGKLIRDGDLSIYYRWTTAKTNITHGIGLYKGQPEHSILFAPLPTDDF